MTIMIVDKKSQRTGTRFVPFDDPCLDCPTDVPADLLSAFKIGRGKLAGSQRKPRPALPLRPRLKAPRPVPITQDKSIACVGIETKRLRRQVRRPESDLLATIRNTCA